MAFLRQCLQIHRLHQEQGSVEKAWNSEGIVGTLEVIAESHEVNRVRDVPTLFGPTSAIDLNEK
jgi:hypothetical protein